MTTRTKRVTASDVARSLGISRATVGFVLNNTPGQTISETTRSRVLAEAERLGYRPHATATALARGSNRLVLFVLPEWPVSDILSRYIDAASGVLDDAGYALVTWTRHPGGRSRPLWETLDPDLVVPVTPLTGAELAAFERPGAPRLFPGSERVSVPERLPAAQAGSGLQVRHLHQRGHTRVAYAGAADPRLAALSAARADAARACAGELAVAVCDQRDVCGDDGTAAAAVTHWAAAGVTGVIAFNDDVAAAVVGAAIRSGIAVPARLAVVGHDDSPLAKLFIPALTSVRVDAEGMGRNAALAALQVLGVESKPPERDLGAEVIRREST